MFEMLALPAETRSRMGLAGREKVVREFDEAIVIERYIEAIAAATAPPVIAGHRPAARLWRRFLPKLESSD
jgi:bifunctional DNA-binding transcriptional regulator/antitoxin component of YhaV-PrlF toxin-antitoxin module